MGSRQVMAAGSNQVGRDRAVGRLREWALIKWGDMGSGQVMAEGCNQVRNDGQLTDRGTRMFQVGNHGQ